MADLVPVRSSNIKGVGYDHAARQMTVQFNSGATHRYHDVAPHTHAALMAAESKGGYFHRWIKDAHRSEPVE